MSVLLSTQILIASNPASVIRHAHNAASTQPKEQQFHNAAMVFDYEKNKIYQIYTKPERITDITLEPQENLLSVAGGDSQRWTITDSISGRDQSLTKHILIKPHQMGISNNLIITTDRRVYHIELHSLASVPYQAVVSWNYPSSPIIMSNDPIKAKNEELIKTPLSGLSQQPLNFNYHFVAKDIPKWMPQRVFDNFHKTYIEFPLSMQDSESPVLWALSRAKTREVINYRRYNNFYIVDHLIDLAELSIGEANGVTVGIEREQK